MKWILAILLLVSASVNAQIGRGDDSTKYIRYQNQYGTRMPRSWWDSVSHMPYGDTAIFPKPCRPGAIMMHSDKNFYKWNGGGWEAMGSGSGSATLNNVGTGFAWATTPNGSIKRLNPGYGLIGDSATSNTNGLKADTVSSNHLVTQSDLNDSSAAIRAAIGTGGSGISGLTTGRIVIPGSSTTVTDDAGLLYNTTSNTVTTDSARLKNIRINENPYNADSAHYRGTSITNKVGPSTGNSFSTLLSNKLNTNESNAGISSATLLVQGMANLPTLPVYDRVKYRWLILEWGVNDIDVSGTDSTKFDTTYRKYIDTAIIARGWPASRVVILAPSYIDPAIRPTSTLAKQAQFRGATRSIATAKGTKWVDIYSAELYRNPANLLVDGIHPNDYGSYVYVNSIYNTIMDSVMSTNQNLSINGYTELQRLKLRNSDTADYKSVVIGQDSSGNIVRYNKDQILQNSETLPTPQGSSISLMGKGYFGNVSSPNSVDKVQVNGSIQGDGIRATGNEPSGFVGESVNMYYASGVGYIYARAMPSNVAKPINIAPFGGGVRINSMVASGGDDKLFVDGGVRVGYGHFTGALGSLTGAGVEIGNVSGSGYIGAYNRPSSGALPLTIQLLGGNTMFGTNTDNGYKVQVDGAISLVTDSTGSPKNMAWIDTDGKIRKAAVPSGSSGITSISGETGPAITIQGGTAMSISVTSSNTLTAEVIPSSTALPNVLTEFYSAVNNSGTSETDLYSYTVPANKLGVNGQKIVFEASGTFNDVSTTNQLRIYFGATEIFNTGGLTISSTGGWSYKTTIIRVSSTTAIATTTFNSSFGSSTSLVTIVDLSSQDFTTSNVLKVTGTASGGGAGSNDITSKMGYVMFLPIPI